MRRSSELSKVGRNPYILAPTKDLDRLQRKACLVMIPALEGESDEGENLPLYISIAPRDS